MVGWPHDLSITPGTGLNAGLLDLRAWLWCKPVPGWVCSLQHHGGIISRELALGREPAELTQIAALIGKGSAQYSGE